MPAVPADAVPEVKDAVPAKPGRKKKLIVIASVLAVLLAAGAGGTAWFLKERAAAAAVVAAEGEAEGEDGATPAPAEPKPVRASLKHAPTFVPLDPFTVNLADRDSERYAQVGVTLELNDAKAGELLKAYMPAIRNNILLALGSKTAAQLMERDGKVRWPPRSGAKRCARSATKSQYRSPRAPARQRRDRPPATRTKTPRSARCTSPTSSFNERSVAMNQQILSQDEVDALLQGITGESQKLEQEEAPQGDGPHLRPRQPGAHRARAHAHDGDRQRALRPQHPHRPVQLHPQEPGSLDRRHQGAEVQRLPARDRGADQLQHRQREAAARRRA